MPCNFNNFFSCKHINVLISPLQNYNFFPFPTTLVFLINLNDSQLMVQKFSYLLYGFFITTSSNNARMIYAKNVNRMS